MSKAIITTIESIVPIQASDNIVLAKTLGYNVIVSKDVKIGQLGVLFLDSTQISEEFCIVNNLLRKIDPDTGKNIGGYFDPNRRVRTTKIRGEKSEAFWIKLDSLTYTGYDLSLLNEGSQFDALNEKPICNKYISRSSKISRGPNNTRTVLDNPYFPKHLDTAQLNVGIRHIPEGSIIYLTEKLHGTSSRFGHVLSESKITNKFQNLWNKLVYNIPLTKRFYDNLSFKGKSTLIYNFELGSRNVIITQRSISQGYYSSDEFRWKSIENINGKLKKGEIIYGEIVGYINNDIPIMSRHNITSSNLKELPNLSINGEKIYPSVITYSYGNTVGSCSFYVYRICQTDPEGNITDLSWPRVKSRATELGLLTVPELISHPIVYTKDKHQEILNLIESLQEGPSLLDRTHIREGVAIRIENTEVSFLKAKSFTFKVLEGIVSSKDNHIDLEDMS